MKRKWGDVPDVVRTCPKKIFRELVSKMLWSLLTLFSVLTYFSEIRQFILSNFGVYFVGLLDGVVVTIIVIVIIFYLASKR